MGLETSPESPASVRTASRLLGDWIRRTGEIWIEGQISEMRVRNGTAWITLRDVSANMSIPVNAPVTAISGGLAAEGHRVVVRAQAGYFPKNGSISWSAREFRPVGIGALMEQLERRRKLLAAEGLFRDERKRPIPFLPRRIGLICGRASAARQDVEVNARTQWPAAAFEVREVAVQGPTAVGQVLAALRELDSTPEIDVIVITRGGGSFDDLLPFSDEALVRAVAQTFTPVVSAIGHEEDSPILDQVADRRTSTPTAAGKLIVPDVSRERHLIDSLNLRRHRALRSRITVERSRIDSLRHRPVLTNPQRVLREQFTQIESARVRTRRAVGSAIRAEHDRLVLRLRPELLRGLQAAITSRRRETSAFSSQLRALSPQATLDRGYAVVRDERRSLVRNANDVSPGQPIHVRVAVGAFPAVVTDRGDPL